jgi:hypothetical protein
LEEHGLEVVSHGRLENVTNIYDETPDQACQLGRAVDTQAAQARSGLDPGVLRPDLEYFRGHDTRSLAHYLGRLMDKTTGLRAVDNEDNSEALPYAK